MRASVWSLVACVYAASVCVCEPGAVRVRYGFYRGGVRRSGGAVAGGRRVFGGAAAGLAALPGACALLDRYWGARCSGAVLGAHWALTAAHCVSPRVAYVRYNARRSAGEGDSAAVLLLYRHPQYRVLQEDAGGGSDVTQLHHDVGLVRTRDAMQLQGGAAPGPHALRRYDALRLQQEEVLVLGFGRTERGALGEQLGAVRLRLVGCERGGWRHCVCGVGAGAEVGARAGAAGDGGGGGVCSGDSGGPVVFGGAQVAVTSLGPLQCGSGPGPATSVFTSLFQYAELINSTMQDTESALRMRRLPAGAHRPPPRAALLAALLGLSYFK